MVMPRYSIFRRGTDLQPFDQLGGLGAAVRFDVADDHIDAIRLEAVPLGEHLKRLADARTIPEINLQPPALRAADHLQKAGGAVLGHVDVSYRPMGGT